MCSDKMQFRILPKSLKGSLNPTLDWICALTKSFCNSQKKAWKGLNPTLDWICALTAEHIRIKSQKAQVLILLWTGYVL